MGLTVLWWARSGLVLGVVAVVLAMSALPTAAMHPAGHGHGSVESRINDVLEGAEVVKRGKSNIYEKPGGWRQANADFDYLRGSNGYRWEGPRTRVASGPDGTTVTRYRSRGEGESIQIKRPHRQKLLKIRYR